MGVVEADSVFIKQIKDFMEIIKIAEEIQSKISGLAKCRNELKAKGDAKAKAIADYDRALAIRIIQLKNGKEFEMGDGEKITTPPVTLIEKIAKGLCFQERLNLEIAENDYKSLITFIDCLQTEINALQSLNRYLDNR